MKSYFISDQLSHIGWAFGGQQCHCGKNPFNWLARLCERIDQHDRVDQMPFDQFDTYYDKQIRYRVADKFHRWAEAVQPRE